MTDDKMPPLPAYVYGRETAANERLIPLGDAQAWSYHVRAYAAEQVRELVEAAKTSLCVLCALLDANDWHPNMRKDIEFAIEGNRAIIAKHKGTK